MAQNFIACDREQELLLPPSLREWLPEDHLAWFVLDAVAEELVPASADVLVFVAIYIEPTATDETAVRTASRAATLKGIRMARHGRAPEAVQALVDRRDSVTSPFYNGD